MISLACLKSHALFGGLTDEELEKIKTFLKKFTFKGGDTIIREGESGGDLYFIIQGSVEILKKVNMDAGESSAPDNGNENSELQNERIAVLKEGDTFGEMELIDIQPRAATVKALEPTVTLILSNMDLYQIQKWNLQTYTIIIMNLAREISRRLRKMDDLMASTLFYRHKDDINGNYSRC